MLSSEWWPNILMMSKIDIYRGIKIFMNNIENSHLSIYWFVWSVVILGRFWWCIWKYSSIDYNCICEAGGWLMSDFFVCLALISKFVTKARLDKANTEFKFIYFDWLMQFRKIWFYVSVLSSFWATFSTTIARNFQKKVQSSNFLYIHQNVKNLWTECKILELTRFLINRSR